MNKRTTRKSKFTGSCSGKYSPYSFSGVLMLIALFMLLLTSTGHAAINIPLDVRETLGISRTNEMVHNGIPIAKYDNITKTSNLIIKDSQGYKIPATFEVLSRWGGGKDDTTKPVKWLLVSFLANVSANDTATYYLATGTPAARTSKLVLNETGTDITVETGPAKFIISKTSLSLFNSVSLLNGGEQVILQNNGGSSSKIGGQSNAVANAPSEVIIERSNDYYACILVKGDYANTAVGSDVSAPLSYKIRYEFYAESPTAVVYHKVYWLGRNGAVESGYITVDSVSLTLPDMAGYSSTDIYADASTTFSGSLSASQVASVSQRLRTTFTNSHLAEVKHGSSSISTTFASQPMLINHSSNGTIATTIDHMKYFEPQSITTDSSGKININVMAENQYFSNYQGTWARAGVSALPSGTTYNDTLAKVFAPLNNRLIAFPHNSYTKKTNVFFEIPLTPGASSHTNQQSYYSRLKDITSTTLSWLETQKFHGLMTWGALVRYLSETGTGSGWDKVYSGAKMTDYHNAWNNVVFQFLLEGDPSLLHDMSFIGARRMLHTQIIQPDDAVSNSKMGWGFSGYGRFRADANSSHSYFENLYNYYYFTGDMEVLDVLQAGVSNLRGYYTRSGSSLNDQDTLGADWIDYTGRPAYQYASMVNFLGHAYDPEYLNDFRHMYNHAFSTSVALLQGGDGYEYGFVSTSNDASSGFSTEQYWMMPLYFMHGLYILYNEYGNISLGSTNLKIDRVFEAVARGAMKYASTAHSSGDGTWHGDWVNAARVYYSGNKIGGNLTSVVDVQGSNPQLYVPGKAILTSLFLRAGFLNNKDDLTNYGKNGLDWLVSEAAYLRSSNEAWGKENAELYIRLHHSMSYYNKSVAFSLVDGFIINKTNFTSFNISGYSQPYADVYVHAGSTQLGPIKAKANGEWLITIDFTAIPEGNITITAESDGSTIGTATGTFDKKAPGKAGKINVQ